MMAKVGKAARVEKKAKEMEGAEAIEPSGRSQLGTGIE